MTRLAVPINLHIPPEPTKHLAFRATAINDYVTGISVMCGRCKARGRANSKLVGKAHRRGPIFCGACRVAS